MICPRASDPGRGGTENTEMPVAGVRRDDRASQPFQENYRIQQNRDRHDTPDTNYPDHPGSNSCCQAPICEIIKSIKYGPGS